MSRRLVHEIPIEVRRTQTDYFDPFVATPLRAMIRFGRWEEILHEQKPASDLPMSKAMWHYARGIAFAATDRVTQAEHEQLEFQNCRRAIPDTSMLHNNSSVKIAEIADAMLRREIAYRKKNYDHAFEDLRKAVALDDALNYDEPWGWIQPTRHALRALLLEQGQYLEAETDFRDDLKRLPKNPWALRGPVDCLAKRQSPELALRQRELQEATKRSDIEIDRPCFCKSSCCSLAP
ncbi:MAG: hypothetical protein ABL921_28690 [Pirellula sp.]